MKRRWVASNFSTEVDVRKWTVGSELDAVVDEGPEGGDKIGGVVVELSVAGDGA